MVTAHTAILALVVGRALHGLAAVDLGVAGRDGVGVDHRP